MYLSWGGREKRVGGAWAYFTVYSSTVSSFSFLLRKRVSSSFSEKFSWRRRLSRSLTGINVFVMHKISHIVTSCTFFISVVWNIKMLKRFFYIQIINAVHETVPVIIDERKLSLTWHIRSFLKPNFLVFFVSRLWISGLANCWTDQPNASLANVVLNFVCVDDRINGMRSRWWLWCWWFSHGIT